MKENDPKKCYIFYGEETYLRDTCVEELKAYILPAGMEAFHLHEFEGKNLTMETLEEAVECLPMMGERTLVVVTDADLYKNAGLREGLPHLLPHLPDHICLVFVYHLLEYKPDGRTGLAAAINTHASVIHFGRQPREKLIPWIRRRFLAMDREIDSREAEYLLFLCGDLMTGLIGEITKIAAYARERQVTRQDINAVATPQTDAVVFQMTDAIGEGDFDRAAAVLAGLLHMQESPLGLLAVLSRHLRRLYSARLILDKGGREEDVAALWHIHPYPAKKLLQSARRFSPDRCRMAVCRCGETELAMKSTGEDDRDLLVGLLAELAVGR